MVLGPRSLAKASGFGQVSSVHLARAPPVDIYPGLCQVILASSWKVGTFSCRVVARAAPQVSPPNERFPNL